MPTQGVIAITKKMKEPAKIDIWGCCTSRDIFGIVDNENLNVGKYFQVPTWTQFDRSDVMMADRIELEELDQREGTFKTRMTKAELNREAIEGLEQSGSDWIVLDLRYFTYKYYQAEFGGSTHYYLDFRVHADELRRSVSKKGLEIDRLNATLIDEEDVDFRLDDLCGFLERRYGKNIIIVQIKEASAMVTKDGDIVPLKIENQDRSLLMEDDLFCRLVDRLGCYYVKCPDNVMSDYYHKWGGRGNGVPVHYLYEYYDYANKCIEIITSGDKDWIRKCDMLYVELSAYFNRMRFGEEVTRANSIRRIRTMAKRARAPEDTEKVVEFAEGLVAKTDSAVTKREICSLIGNMLSDRRLGDDYLERSAEFLRMAVDLGDEQSRCALFDILMRIDTHESQREAVDAVYPAAKKGDPGSMGRVGLSYKNGKGLPQDVDLACEWFLKAMDECAWVKGELYSMLWMLQDPERDRQLYGIVSSVKEPESLDHAYLGRLLRHGRGCEPDLEAAMKQMRLAMDDIGWAKHELFDMLWKYEDEDHDSEAFDMLMPFAEKEIGPSMGRIGNAYC